MKSNKNTPAVTSSENTRATLALHSLMAVTYERVLRGIHYRHEFARRVPRVADACLGLFDYLGLELEQVAAYETNGVFITKVIADAYRRVLRSYKGKIAKLLFRKFFLTYGIIPVAPSGRPFLGDKLRLKGKGAIKPTSQITERDHHWLKTILNDMVKFEIFAIAEFDLPRTIMLPAMMLPDVKFIGKVDKVRTGACIVPSNKSFAVYVNPAQTDDVLGDYLKIALEQAREGEMLHCREPKNISSVRLDCAGYERALNVLDVKTAAGGVVRRCQKMEFYKRYKSIPSGVLEESIDCDEYFKENYSKAVGYRDNWLLIL